MISARPNHQKKYVHYLFSKDFSQSKNPFLKKEGWTYTQDLHGHEEQLFHDFKRKLIKINHQDFCDAFNDPKKWNKFIEEQFSLNQYSSIVAHFSQAASLLIAAAPVTAVQTSMHSNILLSQPETKDMVHDIYVENDEIYIKSIVYQYPVMNKERELLGYLQGPTEVFLKLVENDVMETILSMFVPTTQTGFQLQYIASDSPFICQLFLKDDITEHHLLSHLVFTGQFNQLKKICDTYLAHIQRECQKYPLDKSAAQKYQNVENIYDAICNGEPMRDIRALLQKHATEISAHRNLGIGFFAKSHGQVFVEEMMAHILHSQPSLSATK